MRERVDRIADSWGDRTPYGPGAPWPVPAPSTATVPSPTTAPGAGAGPDLLEDLRDLHLAAAGNALRRETPAQAARAVRDEPLLALATACRPQTLRHLRWTTTMVKTLAPQLLGSPDPEVTR
ncbi:hypothetical protein [Streptomyces rubellomurinus]|uniref:hypothetical protein n=1 Tax=Streptomyces rubellomurinus (strain ATCC 31215) TaxID=359131 RepID=UPI000A57D643